MSHSSEPVTVQRLIGSAEIKAIQTFEISATRSRTSSASDSREITPAYSLVSESSDDNTAFRITLRTQLDSDLGQIVVEVAVEFSLTDIEANEIPTSVLSEFVNNVAVMTLIPYVRSTIADISLRVFESALVMPIVRRGEIAFDLSAASQSSEKSGT